MTAPAWSAPQDNWGYERSIKPPAGKAFGLDKHSRLALDSISGDLLLFHEMRFVDRIHPTNGTYPSFQSYITGVLPTSADEVATGLAVVGTTLNGPLVVFATKGTNNSSLISPKQLRLTDGVQSLEFGSFGANNGQLQVPTGIAVRPLMNGSLMSRLYILDLHGRRITVWDVDLGGVGSGLPPAPVWQFNGGAGMGTASGQFAFMWNDNRADIAVGPNGRVYVLDSHNRRIQVFVDSGTRLDWVKSIGFTAQEWEELFPHSSYNSWNLSSSPDGLLASCGVLFDPALVPDGQTEPIGKDHPAVLGRIKYYPPNQIRGGESDFAAFFHPTDGRLYVINGLTDQIDVYRRGYRTFGLNNANRPPTPVIESIALSSNGLVEAKFQILDPDDTHVTVAALMAPANSPAVVDMIPLTNGFGSGSVTLPTSLAANSVHYLRWTPPAGFSAGDYRLLLLAKDSRYLDRNGNGVEDPYEGQAGLVDVDFIVLPATNGQPALRLSRSPVKQKDLVPVWQWLRATGDPAFVWSSHGVTVAQRWSTNGVTIETNEILLQGGTILPVNATTRKGRDRLLSSIGWRVATWDEWRRSGNLQGKVVEWGTPTFVASSGGVLEGSSNPAGLFEIKQMGAGDGFNVFLTASNTVVLGGTYAFLDQDASGFGSPGLQGVQQIAVGRDFYLCRMSDGTLRMYGESNYSTNGGHFAGLDRVSGRAVNPLQISGVVLSNIVSIAAGDSHALALRSNGTVVSWGDNNAGQTNVSAWSNIAFIAAGPQVSLGGSQTGEITCTKAQAFRTDSANTFWFGSGNNIIERDFGRDFSRFLSFEFGRGDELYGLQEDGSVWKFETRVSGSFISTAITTGWFRCWGRWDGRAVSLVQGFNSFCVLNDDGSMSALEGMSLPPGVHPSGQDPSYPVTWEPNYSRPSGLMQLAVGQDHGILWQNQEENGLAPWTVRMGERPIQVNSLGFEQLPYSETLNIWVVEPNP